MSKKAIYKAVIDLVESRFKKAESLKELERELRVKIFDMDVQGATARRDLLVREKAKYRKIVRQIVWFSARSP